MRPSCSLICAAVYSLLPLITYDLGQPGKPSSCTWTWVPNVIRPTLQRSGIVCSDCSTDSLHAFSSSSATHVSITKRYVEGVDTCCRGTQYSMVVCWGKSSAGMLDSEIPCVLIGNFQIGGCVERWGECANWRSECKIASGMRMEGRSRVNDVYLVVGRELVPNVAEWAHPQFALVVHADVGVEVCTALLAWHALIWNRLW